jgi:DNA-binding NarL/FixJ family response regulator
MFASLNNPDENKFRYGFSEKNNVEIAVDRALRLDRKEKTVEAESKNIYTLKTGFSDRLDSAYFAYQRSR